LATLILALPIAASANSSAMRKGAWSIVNSRSPGFTIWFSLTNT